MSPHEFTAKDADVILRASRNDAPREFRIHKIILSIASPVFRDMFTIPQPTPQTSPEEPSIPIIDVDDTPEDLELFLRMIYPFGFATLTSLEAISRALIISDKYQVHGDSLQPIRSLLVSQEFLRHDPIRVYSLACAWKFEKEADIAAPHTSTLDILASVSAEDIQRMSGPEYHRILTLAKDRRLKAQSHIRTTRPPCSGCFDYKRFYSVLRDALLEDFNTNSSTFYDNRRCVARCFEIAMETSNSGGMLGCGMGRDSHVGMFICDLAQRLNG